MITTNEFNIKGFLDANASVDDRNTNSDSISLESARLITYRGFLKGYSIASLLKNIQGFKLFKEIKFDGYIFY